jgi:hypothetical protein
MDAKLMLALTMLVGSLVGGLIASTHTRPEDDFDVGAGAPMELAMLTCAGGFHTDSRGNCQPDNGIVDSRCQDGFETHPAPNGAGYICVPIPQGY